MNSTEIARNTLAQQTVTELRDLAREAGIRGRSAMRKAELVAALIPAHLAEMAQVAANRTKAVSPAEAQADWARATDSGDAIAAGAAWEDYLDACVAAGICAVTHCYRDATDGDGRCGWHSHGPAFGDDVIPTEADRAMAEELQASPVAVTRSVNEQDWAAEVLTPADVWARVQAAKEAAMAELKRALPQSGYTDCACRDCFDAAISSDVRFPEPCQGCIEDGCELGDSECNRAETYGE